MDAFQTHVRGLINDNPNLQPVAGSSCALVSDMLTGESPTCRESRPNQSVRASLGEALASGPYFKAMIVNLLPYWVLQPFVDAAFKKRGIDPEKFWRTAGLPAFRFPDPNGTRFPTVPRRRPRRRWKARPDHPGPAVPPGSPCSYTPPADGLPRPWNPLPCASSSVGPFGDNPYGPNYRSPRMSRPRRRIRTVPPTPGVPIAGRPGETAPTAGRAGAAAAERAAGRADREPTTRRSRLPPPSTSPPGLPPGPPGATGTGSATSPAGTPPLPGNPPYLPPGSQGRE